MVNPVTQVGGVLQRSPNRQSQSACVRIHETGSDAPVPPVAVDQNKFAHSHFPRLLNDARKQTFVDVAGIIAVEVEFCGFHQLSSLQDFEQALGKVVGSQLLPSGDPNGSVQ